MLKQLHFAYTVHLYVLQDYHNKQSCIPKEHNPFGLYGGNAIDFL